MDIQGDGWVLLHWVYDGNTSGALFVDGVRVAGPFTYPSAAVTVGTDGYIGNAPSGFGQNMGLNATLDEVRLARAARSAGVDRDRVRQPELAGHLLHPRPRGVGGLTGRGGARRRPGRGRARPRRRPGARRWRRRRSRPRPGRGRARPRRSRRSGRPGVSIRFLALYLSSRETAVNRARAPAGTGRGSRRGCPPTPRSPRPGSATPLRASAPAPWATGGIASTTPAPSQRRSRAVRRPWIRIVAAPVHSSTSAKNAVRAARSGSAAFTISAWRR
ncbi:MAG: hypothetical protein HS111_25085 [Kofleriaceae bacterium]|nr:hypothetical protein [Kofleriaceae bacterium]